MSQADDIVTFEVDDVQGRHDEKLLLKDKGDFREGTGREPRGFHI